MKYTKLGRSDLNVSRGFRVRGRGDSTAGRWTRRRHVPHALVSMMAQNRKQKAGNLTTYLTDTEKSRSCVAGAAFSAFRVPVLDEFPGGSESAGNGTRTHMIIRTLDP